MTKPELIELAKRRLSAGEAAPRLWAENELEIAAAVDTALQDLAADVMHDPERRAWLQQAFTLELDQDAADGTANLKDAVGGKPGDLLLEGLLYGRVIDNEKNILWPLRNLSAFYSPQPTFKGYYCLAARKLYTRAKAAQVNSPEDVQGAPGPLTIIANYIPRNVEDVPAPITSDLVDKLVETIRNSAANA